MSVFAGLLTRPTRRDLEMAAIAARMRQETAEQQRAAACGVAGWNLAHLLHVEEELDEANERIVELQGCLATALARAEAAEYDRDIDPATGLWTKRWLQLAWDALAPSVTALLLLDLDGFKHVNDRWGHEAGDEVILAVARRLPAHQGYVPVRLSRGDEFAVLLTEGQSAVATAALIAGAVAEPVTLRDADPDAERPAVTASVGVVLLDEEEADARPDLAEVLRRADMAMYHAKRDAAWAIRPRIVMWQPGMTMPPPVDGCKRAVGGAR